MNGKEKYNKHPDVHCHGKLLAGANLSKNGLHESAVFLSFFKVTMLDIGTEVKKWHI